jgi:cytochrome P450
VCGVDPQRLPNFGDREKLPYITAVVKEGFRWRPNIAEIGAPTVLIKDDEYEGYKFPAGTVFTWNAWAISLSPEEYVDPERFYPERFLNDDLNNPLKGHFAFGPGKLALEGVSVLVIHADPFSLFQAEECARVGT